MGPSRMAWYSGVNLIRLRVRFRVRFRVRARVRVRVDLILMH